MKLSSYQLDIINGIQNQLVDVQLEQETNPLYKEVAIVNALAGCAKSSTAVLIAERLKEIGFHPHHLLYSAFTKKNKQDLNDKLAKTLGNEWQITQTLNAASYRILRSATRHNKWHITPYKYANICEELGYIEPRGSQGKSYIVQKGWIEDERKFIELLNHLRSFYYECTPHHIEELNNIYHLGILDCGDIAIAAETVLEAGFEKAMEERIIDFIDQMWIPIVQVKKYKNVSFIAAFEDNQNAIILVDEAQDTSWLQMLVCQLLTSHLMIAVGDQHQACYAFTGCLSNGMERWEDLGNKSIQYELPINYRCGKKHIELVNRSFNIPLKGWEGTQEGSIKQILFKDFPSLFINRKLTYLVLARKNASLVYGALVCLSHDIPAKIKDKDLGNRVISEVQKILKTLDMRYNPETFLDAIAEYRQIKRMDYTKSQNFELLWQTLFDITEAVKLLFEKYRPTTLKGKNSWKQAIDSIFVDSDYDTPIAFNTIHSGKGGEAEVSVILFPEEMPIVRKKQSAEEYKQELNLCYVASTRSKITDNPNSGQLVIVNKESLIIPSWFKWTPSTEIKDDSKVIALFR